MNVNGYSSNTSGIYQQMRKQSAAAAETTEAKGEYNQSDYLKALNEKVDANVVAGVWNGKSAIGSGDAYTVMVHPNLLQEMSADPEVESRYISELNTLAEGAESFKKSIEASGDELVSMGTFIDENGDMTTVVEVKSTAGTDGSVKTEKKTKSAKEQMEELREKLKEKREDEEKEAERIEEKNEAKQALLDSLNVGVSITVTQLAEDIASGSVDTPESGS